MKRVFVDTSAWYAYIKADDPDHDAVKASIEKWEGRLVTSNFIFDEVVTLVRGRMGHAKAEVVGNVMQEAGVVEMVRILPEDEESAWKQFVKNKDKAYSFTDCTSFALMRRLDLGDAVSTDGHFRQAGFQVEP